MTNLTRSSAPRVESLHNERAWTLADGARLKLIRESKGLDAASLARKLSMSVAQIRQIEDNENSLFYSETIRLTAAKKVAYFLKVSLFEEDFRPLQVAATAYQLKVGEADKATPANKAPVASGALDGREELTSLTCSEGLVPSSRSAARSFSPLVNVARSAPIPGPRLLVVGLAIGLMCLVIAQGTTKWLMPSGVAVTAKSVTLAAPDPAAATTPALARPYSISAGPTQSDPAQFTKNQASSQYRSSAPQLRTKRLTKHPDAG